MLPYPGKREALLHCFQTCFEGAVLGLRSRAIAWMIVFTFLLSVCVFDTIFSNLYSLAFFNADRSTDRGTLLPYYLRKVTSN